MRTRCAGPHDKPAADARTAPSARVLRRETTTEPASAHCLFRFCRSCRERNESSAHGLDVHSPSEPRPRAGTRAPAGPPTPSQAGTRHLPPPGPCIPTYEEPARPGGDSPWLPAGPAPLSGALHAAAATLSWGCGDSTEGGAHVSAPGRFLRPTSVKLQRAPGDDRTPSTRGHLTLEGRDKANPASC